MLSILHQVKKWLRAVVEVEADKHAADKLESQIAELKENNEGLNDWVTIYLRHLSFTAYIS